MIALKVRSINFDVRTRARRRAALASVVKILMRIRDAEIDSLQNNPVRLTFSQYIGEYAVESVDFAIDFLTNAYGEEKRVVKDDNTEYIPF